MAPRNPPASAQMGTPDTGYIMRHPARLVILWVANARKIPNAVLGSVGRVCRPRIVIIRDIGRRFPPPWTVEELDAYFGVKDGGGKCSLN
jgi:hypothetical protein